MTMNIITIPLSKLITSIANVRRTNPTEAVEELAASIAAHGLLQNLTVRPALSGSRRTKACFEVIAGGRRLAALKLLVQQKRLEKDAPIPCHIVGEGIAEEVSLAENALHCPMHPADQYAAFATLAHDHGMSAEDIAARFGVTAVTVRQRLKLGAVSPILIEGYRAGELTLDQMMAFTITDDHAAQERVWRDLPSYDRGRRAILHALTEGQVPSTDRRAMFVGLDAYAQAGGTIIRDLFDAEGGGFLIDVELLHQLVRDKLEAEAERLRAEGWAWVEVMPEFDYSLTADMRQIDPEAVPLSNEEQEQLDDLSEEYDALFDLDDDTASAADKARFAEVEKAIEALTDRATFTAEQMAQAGVFVSLGREGAPRIESGFIRGEQEADGGEQQEECSGNVTTLRAPASLPDRLVAELTAHRTAALRNELAQRPDVALLATVHALALDAFYRGSGDGCCLDLAMRSLRLADHAPHLDASRAGQDIAARHEAWAKALPHQPDALWTALLAWPQVQYMALLAHCVSFSLDGVQKSERLPFRAAAHVDQLAEALALDMTAYWEPTVATYLGTVSKAKIMEAVTEGVTPQAAENIAKLKKPAMAALAEQRLAGTGWLPALLRKPQRPDQPELHMLAEAAE